MKNIDYDSILSGLQRKRLENANLTDTRRNEVYNRIPEIKEIDQKIASSSIQAARNRIRKITVDTGDISRRNKALADKKRLLLKQHGYPENYLEPIYDCPLCKDTGYLDGKPCKCMTQQIIDPQDSRTGEFLHIFTYLLLERTGWHSQTYAIRECIEYAGSL